MPPLTPFAFRAVLRLTLVLVFGGLALSAAQALGQVAVATQDVNLRPDHSSHNTPIGSIPAGDTVRFLARDTTNGYVHVRTRSNEREGWVYTRYIRLVGGSTGADTTTSAPPSPATFPTSAPSAYHACPNTGQNNSGQAPVATLQALNELKNRFTAPTASDIDSNVTLDAFLAPGNDTGRFDHTKGADIVGVITDVQVGGIETVNCEATDPQYRDTHIRVALSATAPVTQRVVVEVTPRWRAAMSQAGIDWSTATLEQTLVGKRVHVRGWLMFDTEHANQSENTNPGNASNWRATAWEIHPITVLEIVP